MPLAPEVAVDADRAGLVRFLRSELVGPAGDPDETVYDLPYRRYLMGTLYPRNSTTVEVEDEEEADGADVATWEEIPDDPVSLANGWMPSSFGLTFFLGGSDSLEARLAGARYETVSQGRSRAWRRVTIADTESPEVVVVHKPDEGAHTTTAVLAGYAMLRSHWRPIPGGHLVTVTVVNEATMPEADRPDPELCLHQVSLGCHVTDGRILEYPSVEILSTDEEDQELRLVHRHATAYAIGHGCAAMWDVDRRTPVTSVRTEYVPTYEVPPLTQKTSEPRAILRLRRLADDELPPLMLAKELTEFVQDYEDWIDRLPMLNGDIPPWLTEARDRILLRLRSTSRRMRDGIAALTSDELVLRAFRLATLAMLMQMRHSQTDLGGRRRRRDEAVLPKVRYLEMDQAWYPFQLAFQLLTLPSIVDVADKDRNTVDLLWFPTGGGKTEAYLAMAAFQIFLRRLRHGDRGAGTTVITRYTLRLLTAQQFQRAAALICACERLRARHEAEMGRVAITIGLWIGDAASPNKFQRARELYAEMREDPEPTNRFQLEQCPWCGTEIIPMFRDEDDSLYGIDAQNDSFKFNCPYTACDFHGGLPVNVVDEALYQNPPTLLIATVDKFARLTWDERGGVFFGGDDRMAPSLIIQDELHLLSGPLGTTVGLYESAVEALIAHRGVAPKVIASTATIRRASEQVAGLFARHVRIFPPTGLDAEDSYFARLDREKPGRLYAGVMSQSHTQASAMRDTLATLAQAPIELGLHGSVLDAYWTIVAYHNSLRELGRTITLAGDDVPARMKVIARAEDRVRSLEGDDVVELTSNVPGAELPSILSRMGLRVDEAGVISLLVTTNMLSVGVDVPRLGLMLVNGQPKSTSEYIQATSRVGRGAVPGLVVTLFSPTKPRDRSHYESFLPYHAALYRHVEPTSVTPYSLPSRSRALHAALVVLVRHALGLSSNDAAMRFNPDDAGAQLVMQTLADRVAMIEPDEAKATLRQLHRLGEEWARMIEDAGRDGKNLYYNAPGKATRGLLRQFGAMGVGWETLNSMRSVDRECRIHVMGEE